MNKKQELIFIVFGVVIILLLLFFIFKVNKGKQVVINPSENQIITSTNVEPTISSSSVSSDKLRTAVPADTKVPTVNDKTLTIEQKKETAVPTVVEAAAPGLTSSFRNFNITGEAGIFTPSKVIVKAGDTVVINLTAVDRDYSIFVPSLSLKQTAKKGETKPLGFHAAESGSFVYYCDICGENTTASGTLVIVK